MKVRALLALLVFAFVLPSAANAATRGWVDARVYSLREGVAWQRAQTWSLQDKAGIRRTPSSFSERAESSVPYLQWAARLWNNRREVAYKAYRTFSRSVPHYNSWICIHGFEGAWDDAGDPYWGGLQMDRGFMGTYGRDMIARYHGLANVWPPLVQMMVAERAYRGVDWRGRTVGARGFYPWPNTARYCNLI